MRICVISLFPDLVDTVVTVGIPRKAVNLGKLSLTTINPRDFTDDVHRTVDDRPYGGGPGMVMKVEPLRRSIMEAKKRLGDDARVIYLSPQGASLTQAKAQELSQSEQALIFLAGRYEGIDERVIDADVDEELSIGDYVLSGGELAAMVVIDSISRLLPDVLGHQDSAIQDSFSDGLLDCPHFTRPELFEGQGVPAVLLSGDHKAIAAWRHQQALCRTEQKRPDLLCRDRLSKKDIKQLDEILAAETHQLEQ